jgi:hypothetical protein
MTDLDDTDLVTHAFEPKVNVPKKHDGYYSLNNLFLKSWW